MLRRFPLCVLLMLLVAGPVLAQAPGTCDPSNYPSLQDTSVTGLAANFCAFTYLPWRVRLPDSPKHTLTNETTALQNYYAQGSGSGANCGDSNGPGYSCGQNYVTTLGSKPTSMDQGSGRHPNYKASATDPLVSLYCDQTANGCGAADGTLANPRHAPPGTVLQFRIPPYARESSERVNNGDDFMSVIQSDGTFVDFGGCVQMSCETATCARPGAIACTGPGTVGCDGWPPNPLGSSGGNGQGRNWQTGDAILSGGDCGHSGQPACVASTLCNGRVYGATYGRIDTDPGTNNGAMNAGDAQPALGVHYSEAVVKGQINHALHVYASCFRQGGGVYPATYAGECSDSAPSVPVGQLWYLTLNRSQIDTLSASDPTAIPPYLKVFAYAAHEHGVYMLDTGTDLVRWMTQPLLETAEPALYSGAMTQSYWYPWYTTNCGSATPYPCGEGGDRTLKMGRQPGQYLDWKKLAPYIVALDPCYAQGSCDDSVSDPQKTSCTPAQCGTGSCPPCDCTGLCGTSGCPPCTPPPISQAIWPFNEGSGTTATTSTTPTETLTFTNPGPAWGAGHTGTALECNQTGSANLGTLLPMGSTTLYSWAFWFQPVTAATTSSVDQPLLQGDTWGFSWNHNNSAFVAAAQHRLASGTWVSAQLPTTLPLGSWTHLAATYDGATVLFYVNGQQKAQVAAASSATPVGQFSLCHQATSASTRAIAQAAAEAPSLRAAPTLSIIDFADVAPAGLNRDEIWSATGFDPQGRVYVAINSRTGTQPDDVGIYRFTPSSGLHEYLGSARGIVNSVGNLQSGERIAKIHTAMQLHNGKLYMATHDFHGGEDPATIRGAHLLVYDPTTNTWDDLSRYLTGLGGVSAPHGGMISLDVLHAVSKAAGMVYPDGRTVVYDIPNHTQVIYNAPFSVPNVSRLIWGTSKNKTYTTYVTDFSSPGRLYELNTATGVLQPTAVNQSVLNQISHVAIPTADGQTTYVLDESGNLYKFDTASEVLTKLATFPVGTAAPYDIAMSLSNDEKVLFSVPYRSTTVYAYTIATGQVTTAATFPTNPALDTISGGVTDFNGDVYMGNFSGGLSNNAVLLRYSNLPGSPPLPTLSPAYGRMDDVKVWNTTLTPAQVLADYSGQVQGHRPNRHTVSFK